jgi:hypothetical protein
VKAQNICMQVFNKQQHSSGQLRAAARYRMGDAECLLGSKDKQRMNGAVYFAGIAMECLLKACLVDRYPWIGLKSDVSRLSKMDQEIYNQLYRWHDLDGIVELLPDVEKRGRLLNGDHSWRGF